MANKEASVAELTNLFESSTAVLLTEYRGLTVAKLKELRKSISEDASYAVVKMPDLVAGVIEVAGRIRSGVVHQDIDARAGLRQPLLVLDPGEVGLVRAHLDARRGSAKRVAACSSAAAPRAAMSR